MIQIAPQMRILVAVEPVDFRKGIDGLAALCREALASEPLGGALFVFYSRRRLVIKIVTYDGQGFWLCQKRLSQGRFQHWPQADAAGSVRLDPHQLHLLLWNGDPAKAGTVPTVLTKEREGIVAYTGAADWAKQLRAAGVRNRAKVPPRVLASIIPPARPVTFASYRRPSVSARPIVSAHGGACGVAPAADRKTKRRASPT